MTSWEREDPSRVVVIAHGYGEHIGRYDHVAEAFAARGASVFGLDTWAMAARRASGR